MAVVVISLHCAILDGAVHPFHLAVGPRMIWLGQAMLNPIHLANQIEPRLAERDAVPVPRPLCELDAVVCENGVGFVGHSLK